MKRFLIFLALAAVVAGGIYYFAFGDDLTIHPGTKRASRTAALASRGQVLGESINAIPGVAGTVSAFKSIKSVVQNPAETVKDISTNIKEGILNQVAATLGIATSGSSNANQRALPSGSSGQESGGAFNVCSVHERDEIVSYLLEFGAPTSTLEYAVDWGDGVVTRNVANQESGKLIVTHKYEKIGDYQVGFAESVAGLTATLPGRKVCIR